MNERTAGGTPDDHRCMARALRLARRGLYTADPNPRVGAVLVRAGEVVGEGWHRQAGCAHAEINALAAAGDRARGATLYVTLEPCCHHGRTGPCTSALIAAGVARVVAAMPDPNPRVAGRGAEALRAAGMAVEFGIGAAAAAALNPGFGQRMRTGRPFVRVKLAASLDGRTAMASGESQWITGPAARRDVQRLRGRSSAILTGIGTVRTDDPRLTVRDPAIDTGGRQPLRVVVDPRLETTPDAQLLTSPGRTLLATAAAQAARAARLRAAGADIVQLPGKGGGVDLPALMSTLAREEVNEVLVEAGATLAGALLELDLVDELVLYLAPVLLGSGARALFWLPGLEHMAQKIPLAVSEVRAIGDDWRVTARLRPEPAHDAKTSDLLF